jgi:hypothetical protein
LGDGEPGLGNGRGVAPVEAHPVATLASRRTMRRLIGGLAAGFRLARPEFTT